MNSINAYVFIRLWEHRDNIAFILSRKGEEITYDEFIRSIFALMCKFKEEDIQGQDIVIVSENSYEWVVCYLAIICSGNVAVPIDSELSDSEIINLIETIECKYIWKSKTFDALFLNGLYENNNHCQVNELSEIKEKYCIHEVWKKNENKLKEYMHQLPKENADQLVTKVFTSGTLNNPKAVMLSQKNILSVIVGCQSYIQRAGKIFTVLPFNHTYSLICGVLASLYSGETLILNDYVKNFIKNMNIYNPAMLFLVPLYIEKMYKMIWSEIDERQKRRQVRFLISVSNKLLALGIDIRRKLFKEIHAKFGGNVKYIICGGAPLKKEYIEFFHGIGIEILNGYGITECSPLVSVVPNTMKIKQKGDTVGKPIKCCTVKISDPNADGRGEILVKGDNVMLGYYNNEQANKEAFKDGWFHTGDIGRLDRDGYLYITGRRKNVIIRDNGKNVYPEEIEGYLLDCNLIEEVIVSLDERQLIVATIYPKLDRQEEEQLKAFLKQLNRNIPSYAQIQDIRYREIPFNKNTSKKLKRYGG